VGQEITIMWHDFSIRYIKHNRTTSIFLALIAFTSATLLSLISSVFYNMWVDQVNQKILMHGSAPQTLEPIVIAYLFVLVVVCIALISMIHNAFEVSMNARLHQLGILQSVGATPKQIRTFLIHEAFVLCLLPILLGVIVGFGLSYAFMELIIQVTEPVRRYEVIFRYNLVTPMMTLILSALTLGISAWIPARKSSDPLRE
jgi:putative ABC transport system permease protein